MNNLLFVFTGTFMVGLLILVFMTTEFKLFRKFDPYLTTKEFLVVMASILFGLFLITAAAMFWFQYLPMAILN